MLTNLVSNAVKYVLSKLIEVSASANTDHIVVMVRDHGIGIPADNLKRIFEPFERVEELSQVKGLGMGLWITKQLVEAHGGTIRVESEMGHGSTFVVHFHGTEYKVTQEYPAARRTPFDAGSTVTQKSTSSKFLVMRKT